MPESICRIPIGIPTELAELASWQAYWRGVSTSQVIADALRLLACESASYLLRISPNAPITAMDDATADERQAALEARRARLLDEMFADVALRITIPDCPPPC